MKRPVEGGALLLLGVVTACGGLDVAGTRSCARAPLVVEELHRGAFTSVTAEGLVFETPEEDLLEFARREGIAEGHAVIAGDATRGDKIDPDGCCPAAPKGWTLYYYLKPRATRSINPGYGRCGYRRDSDHNDSMVALIDTAKGNKLVEVERVLTKNNPPFDVMPTLTDQGAGAKKDSCANCHSIQPIDPAKKGHYIYNGRDMDKYIKGVGGASVKVKGSRGEVQGVRNDGAPYKE